jgi:hypothetical protein
VEIHGRWTQEIFVDGEPILGLNDFPHKLEYEPDPLASDSRYRADLIAWQLDDFDLAMDKKEKLENMQRADRKLREKFGPP